MYPVFGVPFISCNIVEIVYIVVFCIAKIEYRINIDNSYFYAIIIKMFGVDSMEYIVIPDTAICAVNRGKQENESSNIVYRDEKGEFHSIDFEVCATNFKEKYETASDNCIGERKMDEYCFVFYTSGIKTKIVFEKMYVGNIFRYHLLSGDKGFRFLALHNLINKTRYTTYDLS